MSTELLVPFALDANGHLSVTTDPNVQTMQHVKALVSTQPGTRVMMPNYGVPVRSYLFNAAPELVTMKISNDVTNQMNTWEPSITVIRVRAGNANPATGTAVIDVDYSASPLETGARHTATVLVGGDVIDTSSAVTG